MRLCWPNQTFTFPLTPKKETLWNLTNADAQLYRFSFFEQYFNQNKKNYCPKNDHQMKSHSKKLML
tara:strand:+ start:904 stop:1101 length:198 start_codon:yes stop_codon:yes gene_type:complete